MPPKPRNGIQNTQLPRLSDGFTSLEGGMDGGSATNLLPRNKYAFGLNVTARTGYINNRPGWKKNMLSFVDDDTETAYTTGKFQGGLWYVQDSGDPFAFMSVSGHIYRGVTTPSGISIEDLTPPGDPNKSDLPKVWMCQADNFLVIQDDLDDPLVYDGTILRRSKQGRDPNAQPGQTPAQQLNYYEVPTGSAMAYGYGRLFLERNKEILAGDILDAAIPNSAIRFAESVLKNDAFAVPLTSGNITALIFGTNLNTNLGQGPLQAHTESGQIITLNITTDRDSWTTTPIQQIAMQGGAAVSQESAVNVNGDTWYRSADGVRSFIVALRDFGNWGNVPQSREVSNVLKYDTDFLLQFCSGVCFDNRLMFTVGPMAQGINTIWQGLAVIDFDLIGALADTIFGSAYGSSPKPAWEGIWEGINITQITKTYFGSTERCFIFANDPTEGNQIWELSKQDPFDNGDCPILSYIETGSYNFGDLTSNKKLVLADVWIDQLQKDVAFDFKFSPDQYPFWVDWQAFTESAGDICYTTNPITNCTTPVTTPTQYRSRLRLQEPDYQPNNPEVDYKFNLGYDFRFRIQWEGRCRIKGLRVQSIDTPDETTGSAPGVGGSP